MPGRHYHAHDYRFGFNGKEMDNEVEGKGNIYDYGFRIYNPRLGKFLSLDPLTKKFPFYTPYQFAGNKPIWAIDLDGLEEMKLSDGNTIMGPYTMEYASTHTLLQITMQAVTKELAANNQLAAMGKVISNYQLDKISNNYNKKIDDAIALGLFTTSPSVPSEGSHPRTIATSSRTMQAIGSNSNFAPLLILGLAHEVLHSYQQTVQRNLNHDAREFLAYHFTLFPNNSVLQERAKSDDNFKWDVKFERIPQTDVNFNRFIDKALNYYNKMTPEDQNRYINYKHDLDQLKINPNYMPQAAPEPSRVYGPPNPNGAH